MVHASGAVDEPKVNGMLAERMHAKFSRDFATADRIRDELKAIGSFHSLQPFAVYVFVLTLRHTPITIVCARICFKLRVRRACIVLARVSHGPVAYLRD